MKFQCNKENRFITWSWFYSLILSQIRSEQLFTTVEIRRWKVAWVFKHRSVKQNSGGAFTSSATGLLLCLEEDAYLLLRLVAYWETKISSSLGNRDTQVLCRDYWKINVLWSQFTAVKIHVV